MSKPPHSSLSGLVRKRRLAVRMVGITAALALPAGFLASCSTVTVPAKASDQPAATDSPTTPPAPPADGGHGPLPASSLVADPNAPAPPYIDPTAPQLMPGTSHSLSITVVEKDMTLIPGVVQHVWTFNGTVPAPTLRVKVGDTVNVHFTNAAGNKMPHSLDFHASQSATNDEMRTIAPGQAIDVSWKADYAGVYMYHCVTGPPVQHVASGMFGMMIVEPAAGLPKADDEFFIIQNEWYLGAQHGIISASKASSSAPAPDYMAFNGIPNQYVAKPMLVKKAGDRIRIFVLNVGPNIESSFHVVGMVFDTVIKEGQSLLADPKSNPGHWGSQSVDLAPAQGAIVEMIAPENGDFEAVTHTFNFHEKGARGIIQVGDGKPKSPPPVQSAPTVPNPQGTFPLQ